MLHGRMVKRASSTATASWPVETGLPDSCIVLNPCTTPMHPRFRTLARKASKSVKVASGGAGPVAAQLGWFVGSLQLIKSLRCSVDFTGITLKHVARLFRLRPKNVLGALRVSGLAATDGEEAEKRYVEQRIFTGCHENAPTSMSNIWFAKHSYAQRPRRSNSICQAAFIRLQASLTRSSCLPRLRCVILTSCERAPSPCTLHDSINHARLSPKRQLVDSVGTVNTPWQVACAALQSSLPSDCSQASKNLSRTACAASAEMSVMWDTVSKSFRVLSCRLVLNRPTHRDKFHQVSIPGRTSSSACLVELLR